MADLQPLSVDSALEPIGSTPAFDVYDKMAKAHNQKISGNQNILNSQLIQQATELLAKHPELAMTL